MDPGYDNCNLFEKYKVTLLFQFFFFFCTWHSIQITMKIKFGYSGDFLTSSIFFWTWFVFMKPLILGWFHLPYFIFQFRLNNNNALLSYVAWMSIVAIIVSRCCFLFSDMFYSPGCITGFISEWQMTISARHWYVFSIAAYNNTCSSWC